jgi:hypothetical protein
LGVGTGGNLALAAAISCAFYTSSPPVFYCIISFIVHAARDNQFITRRFLMAEKRESQKAFMHDDSISTNFQKIRRRTEFTATV